MMLLKNALQVLAARFLRFLQSKSLELVGYDNVP